MTFKRRCKRHRTPNRLLEAASAFLGRNVYVCDTCFLDDIEREVVEFLHATLREPTAK